MNKEGIIEKVVKGTGLSEYDASQTVNCVISAIRQALLKNERVEIRGLGVFKPVTRAEKKARDIGRDCEIIVPEYKSVKFAISETLKRELNGR